MCLLAGQQTLWQTICLVLCTETASLHKLKGRMNVLRSLACYSLSLDLATAISYVTFGRVTVQGYDVFILHLRLLTLLKSLLIKPRKTTRFATSFIKYIYIRRWMAGLFHSFQVWGDKRQARTFIFQKITSCTKCG